MIQINIKSSLNLSFVHAFDQKLNEKIKRGFENAKPSVKSALEAEMKSTFKVKRSGFAKSWRVSTSGKIGNGAPVMRIFNIIRWVREHIRGGSIAPRSGTALLIPITAENSRVTTKKFYQLVDKLIQNKQTVIRNGVLYMKPTLNSSGRGGVAAGTRISKEFRAMMPKGFVLGMNQDKLIPIALIRKTVTMRRRFNLSGLASSKIRPLVIDAVKKELHT